jgi:hypothetical protein
MVGSLFSLSVSNFLLWRERIERRREEEKWSWHERGGLK